MKYFSTFSGIGGFELGIQLAYVDSIKRSEERGGEKDTQANKRQGFFTTEGQDSTTTERPTSEHSRDISNEGQPTCVGYSEIDKYAIQVYQRHFPNHKNYGDITTIIAEELPDFDLFVGGFPCQSFSIAGKRGGFEDARGTMFFEIARIVRKKQPRLLLLENVKGILSHDKGKTFRVIINTLDELGYDIQWQVLNSKNHGVPQNRERVFIVGHLRGTPRPQVFPFGENGGEVDELPRHVSNTLTRRYEGAQAVGTYIGEGELNAQEIEAIGGLQAHQHWRRDGLSPTLTQAMGMGGGQTPIIKQLNNPTHSNNRVYGTEGVSPTLNTAQGGNRQPFIAAERGRYNDDGSTSQKLEARKDNVTNTLTGVEKDNRVIEGTNIRRLTPTECERLQGFPDGWTEGVSDTQRYKCLGNAVTVNVIRDIFMRILL